MKYCDANNEYQLLKQSPPTIDNEDIIIEWAEKYQPLFNRLLITPSPNEDAEIKTFRENYDNCYSFYWDLIEQNEQLAYGKRIIVFEEPFVNSNSFICTAVCYVRGKSDGFWRDIMQHSRIKGLYINYDIQTIFQQLYNMIVTPTIIYGFNKDKVLALIQPIEKGLPSEVGIASFLLLDEDYHYDDACEKLIVGIRVEFSGYSKSLC
ncbi:MAG: hypothetical protein DI598_00610 [Pseudopedobacter saltans]|uniref:Uncharacterized protein n=1 Tax=Pseudopedobacter saltans TaxID=151895 RepID=A0A2W5FFI0_9SPHI|nr:MAG: hypothetical protein DI598_00610 [Pseudopedobacter saltans]